MTQPDPEFGLKAALFDLRYCPVCGWRLATVTPVDGVSKKECVNHGAIFDVWMGVNGREIKVNLSE